MAETIWSIVALVGATLVIAVIAYFIANGRHDREADEAARRSETGSEAHAKDPEAFMPPRLPRSWFRYACRGSKI